MNRFAMETAQRIELYVFRHLIEGGGSVVFDIIFPFASFRSIQSIQSIQPKLASSIS